MANRRDALKWLAGILPAWMTARLGLAAQAEPVLVKCGTRWQWPDVSDAIRICNALGCSNKLGPDEYLLCNECDRCWPVKAPETLPGADPWSPEQWYPEDMVDSEESYEFHGLTALNDPRCTLDICVSFGASVNNTESETAAWLKVMIKEVFSSEKDIGNCQQKTESYRAGRFNLLTDDGAFAAVAVLERLLEMSREPLFRQRNKGRAAVLETNLRHYRGRIVHWFAGNVAGHSGLHDYVAHLEAYNQLVDVQLMFGGTALKELGKDV